VVSAVSEANAHCIFRSAIGQYVAELPGRFIVGSIYSFLVWICLFFFVLLPVGFWSTLLVVLALSLFVHTITAFSAFGRVIMHSGAMGAQPIFEKTYESSLLPHGLHKCLLIKARANLKNETSIMRQYSRSKPIARFYSDDEMTGHLSDRSQLSYSPLSEVEDSTENNLHQPTPGSRGRTGSLVKFADGFDTNGDRYSDAVPTTPRNKEIHVPPYPPSDGGVSPLPMGSSSKKPPRPSLTRRPSDEVARLVSTFDQTSVNSIFQKNPPSFAEKWLRDPSEMNLNVDGKIDKFRRSFDEQVMDALLDEENGLNPDLFHNTDPLTAQYTNDPDDSYSRSTLSSMDRLQYDGVTEMTEEEEQFDQEFGAEEPSAMQAGSSVTSVDRNAFGGRDDEDEVAGERTGLLDKASDGGETTGRPKSNPSQQENRYSTWDTGGAGFC